MQDVASSFLNKVLTNKRLKERGLVFLLDQYDLKTLLI